MEKSGITLSALITIFLLLVVSFGQLRAQSASIEGTVYDNSTDEVLPGANVTLKGVSQGTTTDEEGHFVLDNIPEGDNVIIVSFVGYQTKEIEVEVDDEEVQIDEYDIDSDIEEVAEIEVFLEPGEELAGIEVTGFRRGQQQAISEQKMASSIKNVVSKELLRSFPDDNTAEVLQRIPGISIQRDQGEGRYVQVRGTQAANNNVSINGNSIPSPEGDTRAVALDVIPSDMLSSIEVIKAITPDMEGSSIGGTVNLNTLEAPRNRTILEASLGAGYNNNAKYVSPVFGEGSFTYGNRFGEGQQWGLVFGGSYNHTSRSTDNNEMEYSDGNIESIVLQDDEIIRTRTGITATVDYQFSEESSVHVSGIFNKFTDQEYSRAMLVEPAVIEREIKDRYETQTIINLSGGGTHMLSDNWQIDYNMAYSYGEEETPFEYVTIYAQGYENAAEEEIEFMELTADNKFPQYEVMDSAPAGAGPLQYGQYENDEFEFSRETTTDKSFSSKVDLKRAYTLGENQGFFKFGGLVRSNSSNLNPEKQFYEYVGGKSYSDLLSSFEDEDFFKNQYEIGRSAGFETMQDLFENERPNFEYNAEDTFVDSRGEDYDGTSDTYAGYAMTELTLGSLTFIGGGRYENISTTYEGASVQYDSNGELIPVAVPQEGDRNFEFFLPMAHLKYQPLEDLNIRLGWTNTYSLPSAYSLAPHRIVNRGDQEVEQGNPDLDPTRSMNLDFMMEYYFSSLGLISGGVFYKDIEDFKYLRIYVPESGQYQGYEVEQFVNGEDAEVIGAEFNIQQQLTFLPGFLSGLGIFANYTYSWSEATVFGETESDIRTGPLPGQSESVGNVALSYQKGGFTGRISVNYNGAYISALREDAASDRYYDERYQLDISATQNITSSMGVYLELLNLTNEPLRYYNGISARPEQQEYYSWWGNLGIKFDL